jgi:hypothetical protein
VRVAEEPAPAPSSQATMRHTTATPSATMSTYGSWRQVNKARSSARPFPMANPRSGGNFNSTATAGDATRTRVTNDTASHGHRSMGEDTALRTSTPGSVASLPQGRSKAAPVTRTLGQFKVPTTVHAIKDAKNQSYMRVMEERDRQSQRGYVRLSSPPGDAKLGSAYIVSSSPSPPSHKRRRKHL